MFLDKKNKGLTLIELLVVIFIISVISAFVFANYNSGREDLALQRAASKLAQDIRRAQSMAGQEWTECAFDSNYKYGYGIYLSTREDGSNWAIGRDKYIIFADCNGNNRWLRLVPPNWSRNVETTIIEKGIRIQNIIGNFGSSYDRININFVPPNPDVYMTQDGTQDFSNVSITLEIINSPSKTKTIIVNKAGLIDIVD